MEIRKRLGKEDPFLQTLLQETAVRYDIQHHQSVHQDAGAVRQPADEEAEDEDDRCLQRLPLQDLTFGVLGQSWDDDTVTGQNDQTRQQKANDDVLETENGLPHYVGLLWVGELADGIHARVVDFGEHQIWHGEQGRRKPNSNVDHLFCEQPPKVLAVCGTDHRQVPIQADEGQNQHAAVQIQSVDHIDSDAQKSPKKPSASRIHSPKG